MESDRGDEPSIEVIPMQLRRQLAFKRGYAVSGDIDEHAKCSAMLVIEGKFVLLDGLNGNVDVFLLEDFRYLGTLDINCSTMITGLFIKELLPNSRLYIATNSKQIFAFNVLILDESHFIDCFQLS